MTNNAPYINIYAPLNILILHIINILMCIETKKIKRWIKC